MYDRLYVDIYTHIFTGGDDGFAAANTIWE